MLVPSYVSYKYRHVCTIHFLLLLQSAKVSVTLSANRTSQCRVSPLRPHQRGINMWESVQCGWHSLASQVTLPGCFCVVLIWACCRQQRCEWCEAPGPVFSHRTATFLPSAPPHPRVCQRWSSTVPERWRREDSAKWASTESQGQHSRWQPVFKWS